MLLINGVVNGSHKLFWAYKNINWTIGPLDDWTILLDYFLDYFWTILSGGGGRPLVLKEGWDAVYQYSGRGEKQTVVTEGGVEDEQLE